MQALSSRARYTFRHSRIPMRRKTVCKGIMENLSENAIKAFVFGQMYAQRTKNKALYSEHLLLGVMHLTDFTPDKPTYSNLPNLTIRKVLETAVEMYPVEAYDEYQENSFSNEIREILQTAEKSRVEKEKDFITPEALLLAMLTITTRMLAILQALNVDISLLKDMLYKELYVDKAHVQSRWAKAANASDNKSITDLCIDITALAKEGKIQAVFGRDKEIERLVQILGRRLKSNAILLGDPGVGKTALVEGLAYKIVHDQKSIPYDLHGRRIWQVDVAAMVAGTSERGALEQKLKELLTTLQKNRDVILFIDEIHTIVSGSGKGTREGGGEDGSVISNILKPALARGEITCIGATTYTEYVKYFQSDSAFDRRFQPIFVGEPAPSDTLAILKGLQPSYEKYHKCVYQPEAIQAALDLSIRYIPDRKLPDKAIDLIDEAGSMARIQQKTLVTEEMIEDIVTTWTGIPIEAQEGELLQQMEKRLKQEILGQEDAIDSIMNALRRNSVNMRNPNKPIASFLFTGSTGVGKTQLAKLMSEYIPHGSLIRLDMSEFMEQYSISSLLGAPPGYVGYEEAGKLTEAVRRKPYSIVLFDEIEKAHPQIWNILLQIMEDGVLSDAQRKKVSFKNTIIILTCNEMPKFAPELLNRFDEIIQFNSLDKEIVEQITNNMLAESIHRIKSILGCDIVIREDTKIKIMIEGFNEERGAREIRRAITRYVEDAVAEKILTEGKVSQIVV